MLQAFVCSSSVRIAAMTVALLAAPAAGLNANSADPAALDCAIRAVSQDGKVRLEATATAHVAAAGSYRMRIAKSGGSGTTRSAQSGAFRLAANETKVLSISTLLVTPGDRYEVQLTIEWNNLARTCHATNLESAQSPERQTL
jgi:hypothetical protein